MSFSRHLQIVIFCVACLSEIGLASLPVKVFYETKVVESQSGDVEFRRFFTKNESGGAIEHLSPWVSKDTIEGRFKQLAAKRLRVGLLLAFSMSAGLVDSQFWSHYPITALFGSSILGILFSAGVQFSDPNRYTSISKTIMSGFMSGSLLHFKGFRRLGLAIEEEIQELRAQKSILEGAQGFYLNQEKGAFGVVDGREDEELIIRKLRNL